MTYTTRTIRCSRAGLSQEQALESLYAHPNFDPATMQVVAIRQAGSGWISKIREAGFPPSDDEGDDDAEAPAPKKPPFADDSDSDDGGDVPDGPPSPDGPPGEDGPPKGKGGESHEIAMMMHLVQQIADALGIAGDPGMPGAEDPMAMGPDGPPPGPPGPPHGGMGGPPPPPPPGAMPPGPGPHGGHGAPPHPPGMTPAFASTQQQIVGRVASFTASETTDMPLHQAKAELEQIYGPHGYKVKQLREARDNSGRRVVDALLSVR